MLKIKFNLGSILLAILPGISIQYHRTYPQQQSQNCARNCSSGDSGDTGDIIHTIQSDKQEDDWSETIYRLGHSNTWVCKNCKQKGDIHYMKQHNCRGLR
jgi:hypothetical protein